MLILYIYTILYYASIEKDTLPNDITDMLSSYYETLDEHRLR